MSLDRARFDRRTVLAAALATGGGAVLAAASRGQGAGAVHGAVRGADQAGGLGPRRHRTRRVPHAGEPLLRPLLRHLPRRAWLRRPPEEQARELRPGLARRAGQDAAPLPSRHRLGHRRVHQRSRPQLAGGALELEQGHQRRLRQHARGVDVPGARARRPDHGLLPTQGPSLLLRPGRRLHPVRQLPLLGDGADAPQPPHGALGHHRAHRRGRRARRHHQRFVPGRRERALGHHARGARRRRGELEGLQPCRAPPTACRSSNNTAW